MIEVYIDGGSRGNPGNAAIGFVVYRDGSEIYRLGKKIGVTTNNRAEYTALIEALKYLLRTADNNEKITIISDSELIVNQINGKYKVKSRSIAPLYKEAIGLLKNFKNIELIHVKRENNRVSDWILNRILDNKDYGPADWPRESDKGPVPEESPGS